MELERKVVSLESEVKIMKGEVKQLLIDLREIMNNAENPFYKVQALPARKTESSLPEESSRKTVDLSETIEEKENIQPAEIENSAYNSENSLNGIPPSPANSRQDNIPVQSGYGANTGMENTMQAQNYGNGPGGTIPIPPTPEFNRFPGQENPEEALWAHRRMQARQEMKHGSFRDFIDDQDNPESEKPKGSKYPKGSECPKTDFGFEAENPEFGRAFDPEDLASLKRHESLLCGMEEPGDEKMSVLKSLAGGQKTDIFMLIELMRWTDHTLKTIEKEKLKEALDLYELAGYLPEYVKTLILKITNLSYQAEGQEYRAGMRDYIRAITQLNTILNPGEIDSRLMHFVFEDMPWREPEKESFPKSSPEERI